MRPADTLPRRPARHAAHQGFTLIEAVVVLAILAVLTSVAWPAWSSHRLRSHRADAQLALMQLQQLQARWRADHPAYATAEQLGAPAESTHGHYRLTVQAPDTAGYLLQAEAQGPQRADTACAVLALRVERTHTTRLSRTVAGVENAPAANTRCWGS